MFIFTIWAYII